MLKQDNRENKIKLISLYNTSVRMRSQIEESKEGCAKKIDVATHSNHSVIKKYRTS